MEPDAAATPAPEAAAAPRTVLNDPKSFGSRWESKAAELGGIDDGPEPSASSHGAPTDAPAPAEKPAKKGKQPAPVDKRAQLEAIAKELGLEIDEGAVTPTERKLWRDAKRRERANLERELGEIRGSFQQERQQFAGELEWARQVRAAHEAGDPNALAGALGHKDFNEFQREYIKRLADPNYMELRRLKEANERGEREKLELQQRAQQEHQQRAAVEARTAYIADLGAKCKASADPLVREMSDDPHFLRSIFKIQQERYDGERTISAEQAIKLAAQGTGSSLEGELRGLYERLHRALGPKQAAQAVAAVASAEKGARSAPVPPTTRGEPATPVDRNDPVAWRKYTVERMNEADD